VAKSLFSLVPRLRRMVDESLDLASRAESVFNECRKKNLSVKLGTKHIEQIYELAYLRAFIEWEVFLEESFIKYAAGYSNSTGKETLLGGFSYERSYDKAFLKVSKGAAYLLWHNPEKVIKRAQKIFDAGLHENVLSSKKSRLEALVDVRHRIAHNHADSRTKFGNACMLITGRRYLGGRPGKMLRDFDPSSPSMRWIEALLNELYLMAEQIVP
jgi:hypothetical protein